MQESSGPMSITLSEAAARHLAASLARRAGAAAVRLSIKSTGCSGFSYRLDYVDEPLQGDSVFVQHGVTLMVDSKDLVLVDGTEIDYGRNGLNDVFKFNNPNERDRCGCGESFRV